MPPMKDEPALPPLPQRPPAHAAAGLNYVRPDAPKWSADDMRAYALAERAAERERIISLVLGLTHQIAENLYGHTREQAVEWAKEDKYDSEADKAGDILAIVAAAIRSQK